MSIFLRKNKLFIALFLVVIMLFVGCEKVGDGDSDGDGDGVEEPKTVEISNLKDFVIVYPEGSVELEKVSADYLAEYIQDKADIQLTVTNDSADAAEYEILIGDTNREASKNAAALTYSSDSLLIKADEEGKTIVLYGKNLMVAGAMGQFASQYITAEGKLEIPKVDETVKYEMKDSKNVIIMIGDGMGYNHVEIGKANGLDVFKAELLPIKASLKTNNIYNQTTDSAASATALSSGYKTINSYLGMDKNKASQKTVLEVAADLGYKTALVTTDSITGATPSGFASHVDNRDKSSEILKFMNDLKDAGKLHYMMGTSNQEMFSHVKAAIKEITTDSEGFFIMIEEAYTDKDAHSNNSNGVINAVKRFDESIAYCIAFTMAHPDTALIITVDHETGGLQKNDDGTFKFTSGDHTQADVPFYAFGKGTDTFNGQTVENTEVAKLMGRIYGVDDLGADAAK